MYIHYRTPIFAASVPFLIPPSQNVVESDDVTVSSEASGPSSEFDSESGSEQPDSPLNLEPEAEEKGLKQSVQFFNEDVQEKIPQPQWRMLPTE